MLHGTVLQRRATRTRFRFRCPRRIAARTVPIVFGSNTALTWRIHRMRLFSRILAGPFCFLSVIVIRCTWSAVACYSSIKMLYRPPPGDNGGKFHAYSKKSLRIINVRETVVYRPTCTKNEIPYQITRKY